MEFVSFGPLLEKLARIASSLYTVHSDVKNKLTKLELVLLQLQCAIELCDGKQINRAMGTWLEAIKESVNQADNLLDTFQYRDLQLNSYSRMRRGICRLLLPLRHGEFSELKKLVVQFENHVSFMNIIDKTKSDGMPQQSSIIHQLCSGTGTPKKSVHSFIGREKEKEEIIKFLLDTESHGTTSFPSLLIHGAGGIGKTALAHEVYNDEKVNRKFSLKTWVCVSNNCDVGRLIREMLDQLGCSYGPVENLDELKAILKDKLTSQKFVLVLDNVWDVTSTKVIHMIRDCSPKCPQNEGSKILLTSIQETLDCYINSTELIKLKLTGLPDNEYWSFFSERAFGGKDPEEYKGLAQIGRVIATNLGGSPLAAKTVGQLLKLKLKEDHWRSIHDSVELGQHIMSALRLSYQHLSFDLKQCFSFLSVTPKDWKLRCNKVVRMWMAHGYCQDTSIIKDVGENYLNRIEDVGKNYFKIFTSMSLFQSTMKENVYSLHDLLHKLAENTSKNYSFRIEQDEVSIPTTVQHLSVSTKSLKKLMEASVLNNLRTLLFLHNYNVNFDNTDLYHVLKQLGSIRVLSLSYCHMEKLPVELSHLIHLRYLDLSHTGIKELPDGVTKLYHLQILNLSHLEFAQVPTKMNRLINLRSLICSAGVLSKVKGIGKMTQLQELRWPFSVQNVYEFDIGQLGNLKELRECLSIRNLENVESGEKAKEARLCEKENLSELVLHWGSVQRNTNTKVEKEILEGLRPHEKLKKLHIHGYKGTQSPNWMVPNWMAANSFYYNNLVSLKLIDCKAWEDLPPFGGLVKLEFLQLKGMHAIRIVGPEFYGYGYMNFPNLRELIFDNLPEWEKWSAVHNEVCSFPSLQILRIFDCPRLTTVPPLPATLRTIQLSNLGLDVFNLLTTVGA